MKIHYNCRVVVGHVIFLDLNFNNNKTDDDGKNLISENNIYNAK